MKIENILAILEKIIVTILAECAIDSLKVIFPKALWALQWITTVLNPCWTIAWVQI